MPKLKRTPDRCDGMRQTLLGRKAMLRISYDELEAKTGKHRNTIAKWFRCPESMTLTEYNMLTSLLDIPADEARAMIPMR